MITSTSTSVVAVTVAVRGIFVTSAGGRVSLLVSDVLMNNSKGSVGFLPRLMGFSGGPKIVPVFRMMFLKDKKALRTQLERWAGTAGLTRLVPFHGDLVSSGAAEAIRAAATEDTNIIFGATVDDRLTGQVWVTVVATGIGRGARVRRPQYEAPLPSRRPSSPGTDDVDVPSFLR